MQDHWLHTPARECVGWGRGDVASGLVPVPHDGSRPSLALRTDGLADLPPSPAVGELTAVCQKSNRPAPAAAAPASG